MLGLRNARKKIPCAPQGITPKPHGVPFNRNDTEHMFYELLKEKPVNQNDNNAHNRDVPLASSGDFIMSILPAYFDRRRQLRGLNEDPLAYISITPHIM